MTTEEIYENVIKKYMQALAAYDLDGLCALFNKDAKIYSPLLGWLAPRTFFEKMCQISDGEKSSQIQHNTLISTEKKPVMIKHFTYHWATKDNRKTTFEVCDVFEFDENNLIAKETIIYDTHRLREDMGGNPLDF